MRALVLCHDNRSRPGVLGERLADHGFEVVEHVVVPDHHRPDRFADLPALDGFDLVLPMGAPWSVYQPQVQGWVRRELDLLRRAQARGTPVLAVCFGAQALAAAMGEEVRPAPGWELGWRPVDTDAPELVEAGPWMHWRHDRFDTPAGAEELARTEFGPQAFVAGRSLAVQFHPEAHHSIVGPWVASSEGTALLAELGLAARDVLAEVHRHQDAGLERARRLVDRFLAHVAQR
jgi:GMP synthase-like glutamine amidotransferase